ncbi:flagellar export protein FliJ [Helicobacter sp. MIT 21-1697]|uniref:flagellar export protein FliJ n=1 Tax=Helicobacter sp. MIT 21-1697 TaxID=2993733 RepID=UPI00224ACC45|nr:flagellar export protein FliJ [Helicobacter sp. MIT 21-1697]MCX2716843.1 flagellar export protein FliJ [Helicobacter sp. MIT 21-1697]
MKTKFAPIVSLRKKDMQMCEHAMMQNESKIAHKQKQIEHLQKDFLQLKIPQAGTFYAFKAFEETKNMLLAHINLARDELETLFAQRKVLQEQYKKCNIEYEKVHFLDTKEQNEMIKNAKYKEKLEVDEIAVMLYNNAGGRAI